MSWGATTRPHPDDETDPHEAKTQTVCWLDRQTSVRTLRAKRCITSANGCVRPLARNFPRTYSTFLERHKINGLAISDVDQKRIREKIATFPPILEYYSNVQCYIGHSRLSSCMRFRAPSGRGIARHLVWIISQLGSLRRHSGGHRVTFENLLMS